MWLSSVNKGLYNCYIIGSALTFKFLSCLSSSKLFGTRDLEGKEGNIFMNWIEKKLEKWIKE